MIGDYQMCVIQTIGFNGCFDICITDINQLNSFRWNRFDEVSCLVIVIQCEVVFNLVV
ncbi:hypothetical protein D3C86_1257160 [compost metagenome]